MAYCDNCYSHFRPGRSDAKYCSDRCRQNARRTRLRTGEEEPRTSRAIEAQPYVDRLRELLDDITDHGPRALQRKVVTPLTEALARADALLEGRPKVPRERKTTLGGLIREVEASPRVDELSARRKR
jgi:hypothetical protein